MQVRLVAPIAHRVPEPGGRERLSIIGDQKCQVFRRCRRDGGKQVRMRRDIDLYRFPVLVLGLREPDPTSANMLRPEANGILTASAGIEQQIEREARFAADWVAVSVLFDLVVGPRMMTGRRILDLLDTEGRVLGGECRFVLASPRKQRLQRFEPLVCGAGFVFQLIPEVANVACLHQHHRFISMFFGHSVERPPTPRLRGRIEQLERRASVIPKAQPPEGSRLCLPCLPRC